jgi:hypothetical protein
LDLKRFHLHHHLPSFDSASSSRFINFVPSEKWIDFCCSIPDTFLTFLTFLMFLTWIIAI